MILNLKKNRKIGFNFLAIMVFTGHIPLKMLRQTLQHRFISRVAFYVCVVSLLWAMDKATQAYQQAQAQAQQTPPPQLQQFVGAIGR